MMKCKFCGCTDDRPCLIAAIVKADGDVEITFGTVAIVGPGERIEMLPCAWLIPEVCSAPACVTKAYEAIGIVIGKRAMLAWMAGIIDGEGTLTIAKQIRRGRPSPAFRVVVNVSNTDYRLLAPFKRYYGGGIYPHPERRRSKRWKPSWTWHCFDGTQRLFLEEIRPHLRGKHRQADLLIRFIDRKHSFPRKSLGQGKGSAPLGSREIQFRDRVWNAVRLLNEKGAYSRSRRLA